MAGTVGFGEPKALLEVREVAALSVFPRSKSQGRVQSLLAAEQTGSEIAARGALAGSDLKRSLS